MIRIVKAVSWACLFSMFWIGFVQGAQETPGEQAAVPIIVVEEPIYDFGKVSQGDVVAHDFRVLNQGTAPLEIKKVKPG
jgi:hypothetical protein